MRHLEKDLLKALNEAQVNILEDDSIISRLETLKAEAAEVARRVAETETVMAEVETVSQQYLPLSQFSAAIYFTLESLNQVLPLFMRPSHFPSP